MFFFNRRKKSEQQNKLNSKLTKKQKCPGDEPTLSVFKSLEKNLEVLQHKLGNSTDVVEEAQ